MLDAEDRLRADVPPWALRRLLAAGSTAGAAQVALDAVCEIVGADVGWCGLIDDGVLRMAAHHGLRTSEMMTNWSLAVGQGVGGKVAATRRTLATRDYRHHPRRVPVMKLVIDDEGIRSSVCAPLIDTDTCLGVLYAAQRRPREWTDAEVHLITEYCRDVGAAMGRIARTLVEADRADAAEARGRDVDQALEVSLALATAADDAGDPGAAIDVLARHLRARVEVLDGDGRCRVAAPPHGGRDGPVRWQAVVTDEPRTMLRVVGGPAPDPVDVRVCEIAARVVALQLTRVRAIAQTEARLRDDVLHDLLAGRLDDVDRIRDRAALLGVDLSVPRHVVCLGTRRAGDDPARSGVEAAVRAIGTRFPRSPGLSDGECVVALVAPGDAGSTEVRDALRAVLAQGLDGTGGVAAGVGRLCLDLPDYAVSYDEASLGMTVARRRGGRIEVLGPSDLGLYGLIGQGSRREPLEEIVRSTLGPLLRADAENGSEYVKTLAAYLQCDRHLERTAASLHVHPNTVRYRVGKAQERLDIDLRDVESRFLVELSLRVQSTLGGW